MFVGENCSAILQKKLPPKPKDSGSFTIPCTISNTRFGKAMLDLRALINVMPYSIYAFLNLGDLKETSVVIQLVDRSNAYPKGVLEDVLVQVNEFVFPVDFYVLDMKDEGSPMPIPLLVGRPFMKTARTNIDVYNGTITMEFDGEIASFQVLEDKSNPSEFNSYYVINVFDFVMQQNPKGLYKETEGKDGKGCDLMKKK